MGATTECSRVATSRCASNLQIGFHAVFVVIASLAWLQLSMAQDAAEFHRTLNVSVAEVVTLDVDIAEGELQVSYGRDGEVSISATPKNAAQTSVAGSLFPAIVSVEQSGNHIKIHGLGPIIAMERVKVIYRIDVPYRTKLTSKVDSGQQVITGILGPVTAATNKGDIKAAYLAGELAARVGTGNLDLQVVGGHVDAVAGSGNISCARLLQGVNAETGKGDITLMVVGRATATVKSGTGRITVGGARDSLIGSTDGGDLNVKAIPHQDWQLHSASGNVQVELPAFAKFDLEASTNTGELDFDRDDITQPKPNAVQFHQAINGGGKRIAVHTESGRIAIR